MTRTSQTLRRLGVPGLAAATVLLGAPLLGSAPAIAAVGDNPTLVAQDCARQDAATTTTLDPANNGSGCSTQAQVGTNKQLTFILTSEDAAGNQVPAANQTLDFQLAETNPNAQPTSANFPNAQPAGTSSQPGGQTASCTTDANGSCRVNVTDTEAEDVEVRAFTRASNPTFPAAAPPTAVTASETIQFRTQSVALAELVEVERTVVQPAGTDDFDATNSHAGATPEFGTPGRPTQVTYELRDVGPTTGNDGAALRGQTVTLSVDEAAFFTPNCTPDTDPSTAINRRTAGGALNAPAYTACSFTPAPVSGAQVGNLTNGGKTVTATTGDDGRVTVTIAEGRDVEFDDNGIARIDVTAVAAGTSASIPATVNGGAAAPVFFVSFAPLNGSSVEIVSLPGEEFNLAATSTVNIPTTEQTAFRVLLRDQFDNLTLASNSATSDTSNPNRGSATLTKTGAGDVFCDEGGDLGCQQISTSNGGATEVLQVSGSFLGLGNQDDDEDEGIHQHNFNGSEEIFVTNANDQVGTQTLTARYNAPRSTFVFTTGSNPTFASVKQDTSVPVTDSATINYYAAQPTNITFRTTPGSTVAAGTVVTVSALVLDQFNRPVAGQPVSFFRSGNSNNCTSTSQNGTGQNFTTSTNAQGRAGFSFTCSDPSTQNVTIVVFDSANSGNELARGTQTVVFTAPGATAGPTSSATPTATTSPTATPTSTTSPSGPPAVPCTVPASVNLIDTTIIATGAARGEVRGTPNSVVNLVAYTRPSTTYFVARRVEVGADGVGEFLITPPRNTRMYAQQEGCNASATVVLNVRTQLSMNVVRNGTRNYTFSGSAIPARPNGLIVSLYRVTASGQQILTAQTRANANAGEPGYNPAVKAGSYTITRQFTGSGRFGFVVRTGQDLQNAPGSSNVRSLLVF